MSNDSLTHLKKLDKMRQTMERIAILSVNSKRIAAILAMLAAVAIFAWVGLGEEAGYILAPLFVVYTILSALLNRDLWVVLANGVIFLLFIFIAIPIEPTTRYGIYIMSVCTLTAALAGIGHFQRKYASISNQLDLNLLQIKRLEDLIELRKHLVMLERGADEMKIYSKLLRRDITKEQLEKMADKLDLWSSDLLNLVTLEDVIRQIIEQKRAIGE